MNEAVRPAAPDHVSTTPDRFGSSETTEADLIHDTVLGVPTIVALSSGAFGEIGSYLPGRRVPGVRVDDEHVEVHVVAQYGPAMHEITRDLRQALAPLLRGRRLDVAIEDIVLPGEAPAQGEPGAR